MDLLQAWANWATNLPKNPPFVLGADMDLLHSRPKKWVSIDSWSAACQASDFCEPGDRRLHLGLLPQPFCGDLRRASVYVLSLNPGLGPNDYYGEYQVPDFRQALMANLQQRIDPAEYPFLSLDPQYSWHGGFRYWHGKLAKIIYQLKGDFAFSTFADARKKIAAELASIELIPYHSAGSPGGWLERLESVKLAKAFIKDVICDRVERGEAIVIAMRQATVWSLQPSENIVCYDRYQAMGAHLTPNSDGGEKILKKLKKVGQAKGWPNAQT